MTPEERQLWLDTKRNIQEINVISLCNALHLANADYELYMTAKRRVVKLQDATQFMYLFPYNNRYCLFRLQLIDLILAEQPTAHIVTFILKNQ